jgi:ketosteroid isomerase-like protein
MSSEAGRTQTNKQIALDFLGHAFDGRMAQALELLASDATWWVLGNPDRIRVSGTRDMARITKFVQNVRKLFPNGMEVQFEGVTAEGERVAVEAVSQAVMADGRPYSNRYHFLVQVREGRVQAVREYIDTQYVYEIQQG